MTCGRKSLNVKCETSLGKAVARETSLVKRISFRSFDASRFTLHERRGYSQAGC